MFYFFVRKALTWSDKSASLGLCFLMSKKGFCPSYLSQNFSRVPPSVISSTKDSNTAPGT